jgi:hypothetical protein
LVRGAPLDLAILFELAGTEVQEMTERSSARKSWGKRRKRRGA